MSAKKEVVMSDVNISSITPMPSHGELKRDFPFPHETFERVVGSSRQAIQDIFAGEDKRQLVIVGPCSICSVSESLEYAEKLAVLKKEVDSQIVVLMRTCFDKPRTGCGWAGFFNDPDLNGSRNMQTGWRQGRKLLVDIVSMGLPVGMELLDADACQNIDELVSYWWLGARTVTSQRLREIASGLSTSVGFKHPIDGRIDSAIEAMDTALHSTAFIATNGKGHRCEYRTLGNRHSNLILRGSDHGPNYGVESVEQSVKALAHRGLPERIMIDVSHGNSSKDYRKQRDVIANITERVAAGDSHMVGFLYESYLLEGNQSLPKDLFQLKPRLSITDGCDSWETTREVLLRACDTLSKRN